LEKKVHLKKLLPRWLRPGAVSRRQIDRYERLIQEAGSDRGMGRDFNPSGFVTLGYEVILGRSPDSKSLLSHAGRIEGGGLSRRSFVEALLDSNEFKTRADAEGFLTGLHAARVQLIQGLPKAAVIVDLGGSCSGRPEGALVVMGYPHSFESLTILELPSDDRHTIYKTHCGEYNEVIHTRQGPVSYLFRSMTDMSNFEDGTVDLVFSGESIEHITRAEGAIVCREAYRILKPGGYFCLDTPNRAITKVQMPNEYINPDHKHEYTHEELSTLLKKTGFTIVAEKGICRAPTAARRGKFTLKECVQNMGIFDEITECYLLYYHCVKK
jgi:SAM-dependent methyltransferase